MLLGACESRIGIAPVRVACEKSLKLAEKMQLRSRISSGPIQIQISGWSIPTEKSARNLRSCILGR